MAAKKKNPKEIKLLGYHDIMLHTYVYDNVENAKAVVVIIHGMQEHAFRYDNFAKNLNKNGFIVVANDLRGHGKTCPNKALRGHGEKDIFVESVLDELSVIKYVKKTYKLPVYLFGHSYGSMLSQSILQHTKMIEKAVLCGTTDGSSWEIQAGGALTRALATFKKKEKISNFVEKMSIKAYGLKFPRGNWMTKDEKVFDKYLQDEYCGGSFPFGFYYALSNNMAKINKHIDRIGNKKIFLICGSDDPVSSGGKYVKTLYKKYLKHGITAKLKIYKHDRHELINETDKKTVYKDVVNFYNS
ncbi:MAG: alpha/beta hydrolase [Clostridia bacterium]|nr:alpha/beta hydrolase [Clostridia bacterium]